MSESALKRAYAKATAEGSGKGFGSLPSKQVTFVVDHNACRPGVFDGDFKVTLESLSSGQELAAAKESKGDPTAMAFIMAKKSLTAVDDVRIDASVGEDDFLWEALDQGGRMIVVSMFAKVGTPDEATAGKAEDSLEVH